MVGIGFGLAARPLSDQNIEDTLLYASREAMDGADLRILSILVTWFTVHYHWVNASRLIKITSADTSERVRALWSSIAQITANDRRFTQLILTDTPPIDLLATGTQFQIGRKGEDPRFASTSLRVPAGVLRDRAADVLTPSQLAAIHTAYRFRILIGPSFRADAWAALESNPNLTASQLARETYASFATAWTVKRDYDTLRTKPKLRTAA